MLKAFSRHKTESKPVGIYGVLLCSVSSFSLNSKYIPDCRNLNQLCRENLPDTRNIPGQDKYTSG